MQTGHMLPFPETVKRLFKVDQLGGKQNANALMHAAIGISGEVSELCCAQTYKNLVEELGDALFYIEAARQQLPTRNGMPSPPNSFNLGTFLPTLTQLAGEFLDVAKKPWVYNRELDAIRAHTILNQLEAGIHFFCMIMNIDPGHVILVNQEKLGVRYPDGVYTDFHATSRLDKAGEHNVAA